MDRGTDNYLKRIIFQSVDTDPQFILLDYSQHCVVVRCRESDIQKASKIFYVEMEGLFNNNLTNLDKKKSFKGWLFKKDNKNAMEYFASIADKNYEDFMKEINT